MSYEKSVWDVLAELDIDPLSPIGKEGNKEKLGENLKILDTPKPKVAVFGCGYGNFVEYLAEEYPDAEIVGLEYSPKMSEIAEQRTEKYDNAHIENADGVEYLTEHTDFDALYAVNSVQETPDPIDTIDRFYNSLNEGGIASVTYPYTEEPCLDGDLPILTVELTEENISRLTDDIDDLDADFPIHLEQKYIPDTKTEEAFGSFEEMVEDTLEVSDKSLEDIEQIIDRPINKSRVKYVLARK